MQKNNIFLLLILLLPLSMRGQYMRSLGANRPFFSPVYQSFFAQEQGLGRRALVDVSNPLLLKWREQERSIYEPQSFGRAQEPRSYREAKQHAMYSKGLLLSQELSHLGEYLGAVEAWINKSPLALSLGASVLESQERQSSRGDGWQDLPDKRQVHAFGSIETMSPQYSSKTKLHYLYTRQIGGFLQGDRSLAGDSLNPLFAFRKQAGQFALHSEHKISPRDGDALDIGFHILSYGDQARYGQRQQQGSEWLVYLQGLYQAALGEDEQNYFLLGGQYKQNILDERIDSLGFAREERVLGLKLGYRAKPSKRVDCLFGSDFSYNSLLNAQIQPLLQVEIRELFSPYLSSQLYGARSYGLNNPFELYAPLLIGQRQVLRPSEPLIDDAWHYGLSFSWNQYKPKQLLNIDARLGFVHWLHQQRGIADMDSDIQSLIFRQAAGGQELALFFEGRLKFYRSSLQARYEYRQNSIPIQGQWLQPLGMSPHSICFEADKRLAFNDWGKLDYVRQFFAYIALRYQIYSPQRLAPALAQGALRSPWQHFVDAELRVEVGTFFGMGKLFQGLDFRFRVENILNFRQRELAILPLVDAVNFWGPLFGRRYSFGFFWDLSS